MNTLRTPLPTEYRRKMRGFRSAPLREEYFPNLDEALDQPERAGLMPPKISPMPCQHDALPTEPTGGTREQLPQPILTTSSTAANPANRTVAVPANKAKMPLMHNPWALNRLSDVMGIFGLGFVFWFALQLLSAVALAWGISLFFADLWILSWASAVGFVFLSDWVLWQKIRGRIYSAAARPALVVLVVSLICGAGSAGFRIVSSGAFQWGTSGPPAPL